MQYDSYSLIITEGNSDGKAWDTLIGQLLKAHG